MNINIRTIDLSGLPRAINFDAQVARNREIIQALPTMKEREELELIAALSNITLSGRESSDELLEICEDMFGDIL